jgi:hypothetical protein
MHPYERNEGILSKETFFLTNEVEGINNSGLRDEGIPT